MERVLITGANRGIGLELVRQYSERANTHVFAATRQPETAAELQALAQSRPDNVTVVQLEVTDEASIAAAVQAVQQQVDALDVLINNAAINPEAGTSDLFALDAEQIMHVLRVNVLAPVLVASGFAGLLKAGQRPRLINISSGVGSLTRRTHGGSYAYSTSKAGVNMMTRNLAADLKPVICIALDPGWVKTDMGGPNAHLEPHESIQGILQVVDQLTAEDNGSYRNYKGETLPW